MRKLRPKDINLLAQRYSVIFKKNTQKREYLAPVIKGVFSPLACGDITTTWISSDFVKIQTMQHNTSLSSFLFSFKDSNIWPEGAVNYSNMGLVHLH